MVIRAEEFIQTIYAPRNIVVNQNIPKTYSSGKPWRETVLKTYLGNHPAAGSGFVYRYSQQSAAIRPGPVNWLITQSLFVRPHDLD